jgi:hypothetical protein
MKSDALPFRRNQIAWILFLIGVLLEPFAWFAYLSIPDSPDDGTAEIVRPAFTSIAVLLCSVAPLFSAATVRVKCSLCILAFIVALLAVYPSFYLVRLFLIRL